VAEMEAFLAGFSIGKGCLTHFFETFSHFLYYNHVGEYIREQRRMKHISNFTNFITNFSYYLHY